MSDLISREAAIGALDKRFDSIPMEQTAEILQLRKDLRELPSAQPELPWIPCNERLPEHGGWYIVTRRITKDNDRCVGLLWYSTAHGWEWDNAIAWMPLPEPYREVSE